MAAGALCHGTTGTMVNPALQAVDEATHAATSSAAIFSVWSVLGKK